MKNKCIGVLVVGVFVLCAASCGVSAGTEVTLEKENPGQEGETTSGNVFECEIGESFERADEVGYEIQGVFGIDDHTINTYLYNGYELQEISTYVLDDAGKVLSVNNLWSESGTSRQVEYTYDEEERLIGMTCNMTSDDGTELLNSVREYSYAESGILAGCTDNGETAALSFDGEQITEIAFEDSKTVYNYDEDGYITSCESYQKSEDGFYMASLTECDGTVKDPFSVVTVSVTVYDQNGEVAGITNYDMEKFYVNEDGITPEDDSMLRTKGILYREDVYDSEDRLSEEYLYDTRGNLLSHTYYKNGETTDQVFTYTYDENSHLLTKETNLFVDTLNQTYEDFEYDDEDNLIHEVEYSGNGELLYYHDYTYDENHNMLTHTKYNPDSSIVNYYIIYTYDEHNQITSEIWYSLRDWDGKDLDMIMACEKWHKIYENVYDDSGNLMEQTYWYEDTGDDDSDSTGYKKTIYEYDENGNRTGASIYSIVGNLLETNKYVDTFVLPLQED